MFNPVIYIGLYSPFILFILSAFFLRNTQTYLSFFSLGFLLNNALNILLKLAIKEPRPSNDQKILEIAIANGSRISFDKFGMPSGHAQNCAYCLAFITLALNDPNITSLYILITFISLFQRYLFNNHTIFQLFIGLCVGLLFGFLVYNVANKHIKGNIKHKKDDNAPV